MRKEAAALARGTLARAYRTCTSTMPGHAEAGMQLTNSSSDTAKKPGRAMGSGKNRRQNAFCATGARVSTHAHMHGHAVTPAQSRKGHAQPAHQPPKHPHHTLTTTPNHHSHPHSRPQSNTINHQPPPPPSLLNSISPPPPPPRHAPAGTLDTPRQRGRTCPQGTVGPP